MFPFSLKKSNTKIILLKTPLVPKNYDLMIPSRKFFPWQLTEIPGNTCMLSSWAFLEGRK